MRKKKKNAFVSEKANPTGSWTGTATGGNEIPEQDADDL